MNDEVAKFSFFRSFWEGMQDLEKDNRLALYDAMTLYAFTGQEPGFNGSMKALWKFAKPNIDSSVRGQATGGKGGRPKKENPPFKPPVKTTVETDKDMEGDRDKDMDMEGKKNHPSDDDSSFPKASVGAAAADAAPPAADKQPLCPICESIVWKNTQTGKYHCNNCFDDFPNGSVVWR